MTRAAKPGIGQGKGGGRPRREGNVVQVRLSLPGDVVRELEERSRLEKQPMWQLVARMVQGNSAPLSAPPSVAAPGAPGGLTRALILAQTQRLTRQDIGLCFVPDLVMALLQYGNLPQVHAALLEATRARLIELRPESGMNRLSAVELDLCPPGFQNTRLSWTRSL